MCICEHATSFVQAAKRWHGVNNGSSDDMKARQLDDSNDCVKATTCCWFNHLLISIVDLITAISVVAVTFAIAVAVVVL